VTIHETTTFADGRVHFTTRDRQPIRFLLGGHQVIDGLDQGFTGMKVGERRTMVVPPPVPLPPSARGGGRAMPTPVLEVRGASKHFSRRPTLAERIHVAAGRAEPPPVVRAVEGVDLAIMKGEVLGLVGESGCGKSTLARMVSGIHAPTSGDVRFEGRPVAGLKGRERLDYLLAVQMIFQDPFASLDPRMRVHRIVGEALAVHKLVPPGDLDKAVDQALADVGLDTAYRDRFPHMAVDTIHKTSDIAAIFCKPGNSTG